MRVFYKGADLIYKVQALYDDTGEVIPVTSFSAITATFCGAGIEVEYTLADGEITTDDNLINIFVQRADFSGQNQSVYGLKIETQEVDSDFASNIRVRIGEITNAFSLDEACK